MTALPASSAAKRRAEAYWFLSSLLAAPPGVEDLRRLAPLAGGFEPGDAAGEILGTLVGETDLGRFAERLAVEHTRLFGGLQEGYGPPPPWESLWREGRLMGETTVAVAEMFVGASYAPTGEWSPLDHLVEEMRFLASLSNGEHDFASQGRGDEAAWAIECQQRFLREHIRTWVPNWADVAANEAREPYYRTLVRVIASVLSADEQSVAETDPT